MIAADDAVGENHPLARRMCVLSWFSQNITTASIFASFGVVLTTVESSLHVQRATASLAIPLLTAVSAVIGPFIGSLANRFSLRRLMIYGALSAALGYAILAFAHSVPVYLAAYALLVGPTMCINGTVLPSVLVTRWYNRHRGRALGLAHMPILMTILPIVDNVLLRRYGLASVYLLQAALMLILSVTLLLVIDYSPNAIDPTGENIVAERAAHPALGQSQLARSGKFWLIVLGFAANIGGAVMLGSHVVAMAEGWGVPSTKAAILLTIMSMSAIPGSPLLGWVADKVGGRMFLAILCLASVPLWGLFYALHGFVVLAIVITLIGTINASTPPTVGLALSEQFGKASFSNAFGLAALSSLPVSALAVQLASLSYEKTGSYAPSILGHVIVYAITGALLFLFVARRASPPIKG